MVQKPSWDATFKVIIFGDENVGKSTLLTSSHAVDVLEDNTHMSLGVDFLSKVLEIDNFKIKLQIFAIKNESRFEFLFSDYVKGANGGIIMYDMTNHLSFNHIPKWLRLIRKNVGKIPLILVGGKVDLAKNRQVSNEEAIKISKSLNFNAYIECSSKTRDNIDNVFETLTKLMLQHSKLVKEFPEIDT